MSRRGLGRWRGSAAVALVGVAVSAVIGLMPAMATAAVQANRAGADGGVAISAEAARTHYLAIVGAPDDEGYSSAAVQGWVYFFDQPESQIEGEAARETAAIQTLVGQLSHSEWPRSDRADVQALATGLGRCVRDLQDLSSVRPSDPSRWILSDERDEDTQFAIALVVRHDLGLPPPPQAQGPFPNAPQWSDPAPSRSVAQKEFRAITTPLITAEKHFDAQMSRWTRATTDLKERSEASPVAVELTALEQNVSVATWPPAAVAAIKRMAVASAPVLGDLDTLASATASTRPLLFTTLQSDWKTFDRTVAAVRHDLGLPPTPPRH